MLTLAFDTATRVATAALVQEGEVLGERVSRAVSVLEDADELLRAGGVERTELTGLVVGTGPGSFTGLRLGLAAARGLALALELPVAGVSTLDALGAGAPGALPVVDAGRREEGLDLLSGLDERQLNRVVRLLRPRFTVPNERIIRKGDRGDAVFFIASGAVDVALPTGPVRLGSGEFFGEMALLSGRPRQADVTALTYCRLLVLRKTDFERFIATNPEARATISRVAQARQSMNQDDRDRAKEAASL